MGAHPSVFVSSVRGDREIAEQVTKSLNDAGLNVRRPETELQSGERWADAVKVALVDSDVMLVIVPAEGVAGSNNVFFELGAAEALNKPVVAVVKNLSDLPNIKKTLFVPANDLSGLVGKVRAASTLAPALEEMARMLEILPGEPLAGAN